MMKIALVHDWLNGMRGGEKVLEHLCDLYPDAPIFTLHSELDAVSEKIKKHTVVNSYINALPLKKNYYRYYLPLFPGAIEKFRFDTFDLVISTSHCAAKGAIVPEGTCHICYCFTPMRYVWTLPEDYFGKNPLKKALLSPFLHHLKKWDVESSKRVYRFLCISQITRERIKEYYSRNADVLFPPCNISFSPEAGKGDFYLILSALVPYKRIDLAIAVFNELGLPLRIAGTGTEEKKLKRMASKNITFLGWVSEEEKSRLLGKAKALVFPGIEDFGITPLESAARGTPVIACRKGGALETIREGETGIFFDEQSEGSLKQAVISFEKKPFMVLLEPEDFSQYSPENFRKKFLKTVEETYAAFKRGQNPF